MGGEDYVYLVTPRPEACLNDVVEVMALAEEEAKEVVAAALGALAALHERG